MANVVHSVSRSVCRVPHHPFRGQGDCKQEDRSLLKPSQRRHTTLLTLSSRFDMGRPSVPLHPVRSACPVSSQPGWLLTARPFVLRRIRHGIVSTPSLPPRSCLPPSRADPPWRFIAHQSTQAATTARQVTTSSRLSHLVTGVLGLVESSRRERGSAVIQWTL